MPQYDVFISHSGLDDQLAGDVTALLLHNKITAFCTPTSIPSGKWEEQIEEALRNATDMWVLLAPNALEQSVWVHHELGYYYGFRHGQGGDRRGERCHYIFGEGTAQPGLYAHLQGIPLEQIGDPIVVAKIIAKSIGKDLKLPDGWQHKVYKTSRDVTSDDDALFQNELSDFDGKLISDIRKLGHWETVIRPTTFVSTRVADISSLFSIVQQSHAVARSSWDFPSMYGSATVAWGSNWCGDRFDSEIPEEWRLYQSGQFVDIAAFWKDGLPTGKDPVTLLGVAAVIRYFTLVFEFAANISKTEAWGENISITIATRNIHGRKLAGLRRVMGATEALNHVVSHVATKQELNNEKRTLACQAARDLFQRFGWSPEADQLGRAQSQMF